MGFDARTMWLCRPGIDAIVLTLQASWPKLVTLTPGDLCLGGDADPKIALLQAIQELSDDGMVSYEAIVFDLEGTRIIDVALTARGRAGFALPYPKTG